MWKGVRKNISSPRKIHFQEKTKQNSKKTNVVMFDSIYSVLFFFDIPDFKYVIWPTSSPA